MTFNWLFKNLLNCWYLRELLSEGLVSMMLKDTLMQFANKQLLPLEERTNSS